MNTSEPLVVVVIPNWNLKKDLGECLETLKASDYPNLEVIVVDNASVDGSADFVRTQHPWAQVIERADNGGYAAALNTGMRAAAGRNPAYYLALNNDTLLPPQTITQLVAVMEADPRIGIAAPKVIYHDHPERIFSLGDRIFPWLPLPVRYGLKQHDRPEYGALMEFDYVFGCALLIRSDLLRQIGLLDASYFMFYEDADFCRRARDAGWRIVRVGSAIVHHKASLSVKQRKPQMVYYRARNRSRFYRRYRHGPAPFFTAAALLIGSAWTILKAVLSGRGAEIGPYVRGAWQGWREALPPLTDTKFEKEG